jgi:hypothetical protein
MPYILMRRTDIPNGVLQIDELKPNDSQRNYTLDPPGQSGYVRNIPDNQTVITAQPGGAGTPVLTTRDFCGLGAYLIDNVADSSGAPITAAVANAASAGIIARVQTGQSVTLANVNTILVAAGATAGTSLIAGGSTGTLAEVLMLLMGAKYQLPAGSIVGTTELIFNPVVSGFFATTPGVKTILATGAFNISNGAGDLFNFKQATFEYNGSFGPAVLVLANDGTVL